MKSDYLKYWRVVRQFIKMKYGLTQSDLDILLFLYSEKYFKRAKFDEFNKILGWEKPRFHRLMNEGWIDKIERKHKYPIPAIYCLSQKGINVVRLIYKKLNGEEIPVTQANNKMFAKNVSYTDKRYRDMIISMKDSIRQQRRDSPE
jgi:hypothetical protein